MSYDSRPDAANQKSRHSPHPVLTARLGPRVAPGSDIQQQV